MEQFLPFYGDQGVSVRFRSRYSSANNGTPHRLRLMDTKDSVLWIVRLRLKRRKPQVGSKISGNKRHRVVVAAQMSGINIVRSSLMLTSAVLLPILDKNKMTGHNKKSRKRGKKGSLYNCKTSRYWTRLRYSISNDRLNKVEKDAGLRLSSNRAMPLSIPEKPNVKESGHWIVCPAATEKS